MTKHLLTLITFFGKPLQYLRVQLRKLRGKAIHCCTFRRHLQFAVEKFGLIFAPATDHALTHSILASNLRVLFHSFCVSNNFEFESHIVRWSAYLWHDEYKIDWLLTLVSGCSLLWVIAFILKFFSISIHDHTGWLNVYNNQSAFHFFQKGIFFGLCMFIHLTQCLSTYSMRGALSWIRVNIQVIFFVELRSRLIAGTFSIFLRKVSPNIIFLYV